MSTFTTIDQTFNLLVILANNIDWKSLDGDIIQYLINNPSQSGAQFTAFLRNEQLAIIVYSEEKSPLSFLKEPTTLIITYGLSFQNMINVDNYHLANSNITAERFPIMGEDMVKIEAGLFHFNRPMSSDSAVKEIRLFDSVNPWRPGQIEHLVAFRGTHSKEHDEHTIVALGSVAKVDGDCLVPYCDIIGTQRNLDLGRWSDYWSPVCHFLAIRAASNRAIRQW